MSLFSGFRRRKGRSGGSKVTVPGWHLISARDGGRVERRLEEAERRLRRLDTPDPIALLEQRFGEVTLREMIEDAALVELMQETLLELEQRHGDPQLLGWGQPVMLDPVKDGYQSSDPEHSDRWIMLIHNRYEDGGTGPVPLNEPLFVYYHARRGLLAAIDRDNPENATQTVWYFAPANVRTADCVSIADGFAHFRLSSHASSSLELGETELQVPHASLAATEGWAGLAQRAQEVSDHLAAHGRANFAPTLQLVAEPATR